MKLSTFYLRFHFCVFRSFWMFILTICRTKRDNEPIFFTGNDICWVRLCRAHTRRITSSNVIISDAKMGKRRVKRNFPCPPHFLWSSWRPLSFVSTSQSRCLSIWITRYRENNICCWFVYCAYCCRLFWNIFTAFWRGLMVWWIRAAFI